MKVLTTLVTIIVFLSGCASAATNKQVVDVSALVDIGSDKINVKITHSQMSHQLNVIITNNSQNDILIDSRSIGYKVKLNAGVLHTRCKSGELLYIGEVSDFLPERGFATQIGHKKSLSFDVDFYGNFKRESGSTGCEVKYRVITEDPVNKNSILLESNSLSID